MIPPPSGPASGSREGSSSFASTTPTPAGLPACRGAHGESMESVIKDSLHSARMGSHSARMGIPQRPHGGRSETAWAHGPMGPCGL